MKIPFISKRRSKKIEREARKVIDQPRWSVAEVQKMLDEAYEMGRQVGYNDGRRDGIAVAREAATNSLKEIIWQQNKQTKA